MKEVNRAYQKHVYVCTNPRESPEPNCANVDGIEIFQILKKYVLARRLYSTTLVAEVNNDIPIVEVESAKCLGECNNIGTTVSIYHLDKGFHNFFREVTREDLDNIVKIIDPNYDKNLLHSIIAEVFKQDKTKSDS